MMEESTPRTSAKWRPHNTFAETIGMTEGKGLDVENVERQGSVF